MQPHTGEGDDNNEEKQAQVTLPNDGGKIFVAKTNTIWK